VEEADPRITLVTRRDCHLCDEARLVVAAVAGRTSTRWSEVDVDTDPDLLREYSDQVPVVLVDGRRHSYWHVSPAELEAALASGPGRSSRWIRRR
jgi:hypothetical protein